MQGWQWFFLLLVLLSMMFVASSSRAQTDYPGGYTVMPIDANQIVLLSMTVDVSFQDDGAVTFANVLVNYRLHNRDKAHSQKVQVAVPGYPAPKPPPTEISLLLNGHELNKKPGNTQWWVATVALKPDARANLVMSYRAPLGDSPVVHFRYPMALTSVYWPGTLESARFSITFASPPNPQSWIDLKPGNYELTAEAITWSYDVTDPAEDIDYLFIRPTLWQKIQDARHAAVTEKSAASYNALAAIYAQLATSTKDPVIFERYYPLAVASYAQAKNIDPNDARSYVALAQLYQLQANLSPGDAASYISLALSELAEALKHGAGDETIRHEVEQGFLTLIERARARGDYDAANTYFQRLDDLAQQIPDLVAPDVLQTARNNLALDWATQVLNDQGPAPAREVLLQLFGDNNLSPGGQDAFSRINSLYMDVRTEPHLRTLEINAAVRDDTPILAQLAQSLANTQAADVSIKADDASMVHLEIPFSNANDLRTRLDVLARAVPPEPEWAMIRAALRPTTLEWEQSEERWRTVETFKEHVTLVPVSVELGGQALRLEQAASNLEQSDPLNVLLAKIWRQEALLWRKLGENSNARYTLTMTPNPGAPQVQSWILLSGEERTMSGSVTQYQLGTLFAVVFAAYLLFVLVSWLLIKKPKFSLKKRTQKRVAPDRISKRQRPQPPAKR
ncbi:MAG: hypothetical protein DSY55_03720 [Clostridia bacterium]|nr:MAG: hypothetical protein DSY55_03720 [Clostridia bacterium]